MRSKIEIHLPLKGREGGASFGGEESRKSALIAIKPFNTPASAPSHLVKRDETHERAHIVRFPPSTRVMLDCFGFGRVTLIFAPFQCIEARVTLARSTCPYPDHVTREEIY